MILRSLLWAGSKCRFQGIRFSTWSASKSCSSTCIRPIKLSISSDNPAATVDDLSNIPVGLKLKDEQKVRGDRSYFPWRHSSLPLDRLNPEHPEFITKGPSGEGWPTHVQAFQLLYVGRELGLPIWKTLFTNKWQEDLAHEFSRAFAVAVAALVSGRYGVPMERVLNDAETISVNFDNSETNQTTDRSDNSESSSLHSENGRQETREKENEGIKDNDENNESIDSKLMLDAMLEENLQHLYSGAVDFSKGDSMQVKLETRPISSRLLSANVIPFVTRKDVKTKPSLKSALLDLRDQFKNIAKSRDTVNDLVLEARKWFEKETGHKEWRTIVVQAEINCIETFYVRDVASDTIVQGNPLGTEQGVTHIVKFEMVTTEGEVDKIPLISLLGPPEKRILGSWQITDWDDLLDGNTWYKSL